MIYHFLNKNKISLSVLANNIQDLRKKMGYSRQNLAQHMGWSINQLTTYELGLKEPNALDVLQLAHFFNTPPETLVDDKDVTNRNIASTKNSQHMIGSNTISEILPELIRKTEDLQKMLSGLRAFHELSTSDKMRTVNADEYINQKFKTAIDLLDAQLKMNWELIERLKH